MKIVIKRISLSVMLALMIGSEAHTSTAKYTQDQIKEFVQRYNQLHYLNEAKLAALNSLSDDFWPNQMEDPRKALSSINQQIAKITPLTPAERAAAQSMIRKERQIKEHMRRKNRKERMNRKTLNYNPTNNDGVIIWPSS